MQIVKHLRSRCCHMLVTQVHTQYNAWSGSISVQCVRCDKTLDYVVDTYEIFGTDGLDDVADIMDR